MQRDIKAERMTNLNFRQLVKIVGPGLLFASAAIGTSHLVLSTRAGAHHGMVFFWIILGALLFKYPFFEFGPRYANATGHSILKGYKEQGTWAVLLFLSIIFISMFAVVGAVGSVCAGLLSTMYGMSQVPIPYLLAGVLLLTGGLLIVGRYAALDRFVRFLSIVLMFSVLTAYIAVLIKGPIEVTVDFVPNTKIWEGAGLALMVSLIGWMPSGMETSAMNSIWVVEKMRTTNYHPSLKESLFDFNLGYIFTSLLAFMFLTIGAFTVYGSGQLLEGNSTVFSNRLLKIFTTNLGPWSYSVFAILALGTIYGTLIAAWDAFTRSFNRSLRALKFERIEDTPEQLAFLRQNYLIVLPIIGLGGFLLSALFKGGMIQILVIATIFSFLATPVISFLNLRAIQSNSFPESHKPPQWLMVLAYIGLVAMVLFSAYYIYDLFLHGGAAH